MTTALAKPIAGNTLSDLLKQPRYADRIKEVMRERAMQFTSSILQAGAMLGKDCDPHSIIAGAMIAAAVDLPLDRNLGFCWLVPYKVGGVKYAQFQMGYKGYVQLALRTGQYSRLNVCEIYEGELVNYDRFTGDIKFDADKKTSDKIIGYASYLRLVTGFEHAEFWATKDVQDHAKRYSQSYRAGGETPWKTNFDEMGMKTVLSAHIRRWGPMSIQVSRAHAHDQAVMQDIDAEPSFFDNQPETTGPKKKPALPRTQAAATEPETEAPPPETEPEPAEQPAPKEPEPQLTVQEQLAKKIGVVPFEAFSTWAVKLGHITADEHADATSYAELSDETCTKLLANAKALKNVVTLHSAQ